MNKSPLRDVHPIMHIVFRAYPIWISLCIAGCLGKNELGNLRAQNVGGTVAAPLPEERPLQRFETACGSGDILSNDTPAIQRAPYVQRISPSSAVVLWTTTPRMIEPEVAITTPDGQPTTAAPARIEIEFDGRDQYRAEISDLEPHTTYCYTIRDSRGTVVTTAGFQTAPIGDAPVSFIAFGDSGGDTPDQAALAAQMERFEYDLILHTGDVAYGKGRLDELETRFFPYYAPLIKSLPMFLSLGNHDYGTDRGAPYLQVFALPENGPAEQLERWYSFDWGRVHFVAIDTMNPSAPQADWLDADLTANDQPWVVVYGHHPPYSSGQHGSEKSVRNRFAPLFAKHRVSLVLSGHEHNYERTRPQRGGVTYVVSGGGGVGTRNVGKSGFTAFSEKVIHFVHVEVNSDTMTLRAIDATGQQFDSAVIRAN